MLNGFSKYFEKNVIAKWEEKSRDLTLNHLSEHHNFKCGEIRYHESALTHHTGWTISIVGGVASLDIS